MYCRVEEYLPIILLGLIRYVLLLILFRQPLPPENILYATLAMLIKKFLLEVSKYTLNINPLGAGGIYMPCLSPLCICVFLLPLCLIQLSFYVLALLWLATRSLLPFRRQHRYAKRGMAAVWEYSCPSPKLCL